MSVLIEFTEGTDKRSKGDRLRVDEGSAKSLVDKKKVAKRVDESRVEEPARSVKPATAPAAAGGGE